MHEVALACEMLDVVVERARARRVHRVIVEIGTRTCVSPDALAFAFEVASAETVAQGAAFEVKRIEGGTDLRLKEIEVS